MILTLIFFLLKDPKEKTEPCFEDKEYNNQTLGQRMIDHTVKENGD